MPVGSRRDGEAQGGGGCQRVPRSTRVLDKGHECPGGTVGPCVSGSPGGAIARSLKVGDLVVSPRIPGVRVPRSPSLHPGFLRPLQAPSFRDALLPPSAHSVPHLEFTDLRRPQSRTPVSRHRPRAGRCHLRPPTSRAGGGACGTNEPALWLCSRLRKKVRKRRQMPLWVGL